MAVKETLYTIKAFNFQSAIAKNLCAVVDGDNNIVGTGIAKSTNNGLTITVNGVKYNFNSNGEANDTSSQGYFLKMAQSEMVNNVNSQIGITNKALVRKMTADTGDIVYETPEVLDKTYEIPINTLNARDQFALQALHGMMDKIEDPSALGKNEITHYCEAAYLWASYMMTESSKTRAVIKDDESVQNTTFDEIGILDSNTEKLLNNLVIALSRTDEKRVNGEIDNEASVTYYERLSIPDITAVLKNYVKDGNSTVGLKDVITAINSLKATIEVQTTAIESIVTAISNLQLSPTINNNIVVPETTKENNAEP